MIYDCFIFFNELDLLEIRLNVLNDVVDKFVIVEATRTHQNNPKPLYYQINKERFASFQAKIIHVVVSEYPSFYKHFRVPTSWDLERHQRNEIKRGLIECRPDDTIMISDLDEIPNPHLILASKNMDGIKVFRQNNFCYYLNCAAQGEEKWWWGTIMARVKDFKRPQQLRAVINKLNGQKRLSKGIIFYIVKSVTNPVFNKKITIHEDGGWHFTFLGGVEKIIEKLESFAHKEYNREELKSKESILASIENGKDILGNGTKHEFITVDDSFPQYLRDHQARYRNLFHELDSNKSKD
jgi:beta-1,4-mannosyl-glycoprotein beta-1,4-N-acetylglucosaminyltransferase